MLILLSSPFLSCLCHFASFSGFLFVPFPSSIKSKSMQGVSNCVTLLSRVFNFVLSHRCNIYLSFYKKPKLCVIISPVHLKTTHILSFRFCYSCFNLFINNLPSINPYMRCYTPRIIQMLCFQHARNIELFSCIRLDKVVSFLSLQFLIGNKRIRTVLLKCILLCF